MQAALTYGRGDIRVEEIETPQCGERDIVIRTENTSICGTDVRMFENGYRGISESSPLIMGHEICGTIEEVGGTVGGPYARGQRVVVAPNMGCGQCRWCVDGSTHLCPDYEALGISMNGGFAQYVLIPAAAVQQGNVCLIPDAVRAEDAALAEPLSCVYNAYERYNLSPGDTVVILGAGPIGVMHAMMSRMGGAGQVIINDLSESRLTQARNIDPAFTTVASSHVEDAVFDLTGGAGADVIVSANPSPAAQALAVQLAAINGRVIFFGGIPAHADDPRIDTNLIHYRQLYVTGTTRQSIHQFRKALDLIAQGLIDVQALITNRFALDEIYDALEAAIRGDGLKLTIDFA